MFNAFYDVVIKKMNIFFLFPFLCQYGTFNGKFKISLIKKTKNNALWRNYIKVQMGGESSVCDLLAMCALKNTDATSHSHNDQRNLPRITACYKTCFFWALNNGANTSELMSANLIKSSCVLHLNTLLP